MAQGLFILGSEIMLKSDKEKIINELTESLSRSTIVIATDYRGVNAKEMVALRQKLSAEGLEYKVAKNTLVRFAAQKAGKEQLDTLLNGPLAVLFGFDDVVKPAKILTQYVKSSNSVLQIKGGILGDQLVTTKQLTELANIPSKEILVSQLLGQLWSPVQRLHTVLSSPLSGLVNVLQAQIRKVEGE
jgi:large subunit ribosomal protein L10